MLEMIERTPSSSILFSHMPTFSLKKLLRNHCSVAFAGKTSMLSSSGAMSVGNSGSFFCFCPSEDKVDVVIAPTALHLGHVKAPLEGLGMQVRLCIALDGHGYRDVHNAS